MSKARRRIRATLAVVTTTVLAAAVAAGASAQPGSVLVVGDSLQVGTGPHLRRELGSTPLTIDARKSRPSAVGLGVLTKQLRPGHRVVVFDLGVNDDPSRPAALKRNLESVRKLVGDRCLVVATLSRPPLNGIRIDGMNRVITDFVAETPGAQLFDWHDATTSDRGLLGGDGLHPGPAGYVSRAQLLAGAIESCLDPGGPVDDTDGDLLRPRDTAPVPRSEPRRRSPAEPAWINFLRELPYQGLLSVITSAIDRVDGASREMAGAVSPPRVEPKLGAPPEGSTAPGRGRRGASGSRRGR